VGLQPSETNELTIAGRKAFLVKIVLIILLLLAFPLAWRWTPLGAWINVEAVIDWQQSVKDYPAAFYLVVGTYLLGSLVLFPVTILNVATVFTFGPIVGNVYALAGWLASAAMGYGIGRTIGGKMLQTLARAWLERLTRPAGRHGFLTVLTFRVFPVAPFTVVNIFVGAWRIRFWDFFMASIVGRIPGIILLTLAGVQVESLLRQPGVIGVFILGLTLVLAPLMLSRLSKCLLSGDPRQPASSKSWLNHRGKRKHLEDASPIRVEFRSEDLRRFDPT
jgi:phospholipase D1/2